MLQRSRLVFHRNIARLGISLAVLLWTPAESALAANRDNVDLLSSAVDARGVRHRAEADKTSRWLQDATKIVGPEYPSADRRNGREGLGVFRLTIDPKTGVVTDIATVKSTGFASLDHAASVALRQWRWKPGRWKEVVMPINFVMVDHVRNIPPGPVFYRP
jgi:TonB family protein